MLTLVIAPQELMTTNALEVLNTGFGLARAEDHKRLRLHSWCDKIRSNRSQRQAQGEHEMLTPVIAPQELMTTDALEVLNTGFGLARAEDHKRLRLHSWCDKIRSNRSQRQAQGEHEMLPPVIAPQELMTTDALEVLNTGFGLARAEDHKRLRLHSWCDKIRSNRSQRQAQGEHEMLTPVIAPQELMTTDALEVLNTGFGLARAEDHKRLRLHSWCDKIRSNRSQRQAQGEHEMLTPVIAPQELMTTDALEVLNTGFGMARAEDHKRLRLHSWCDKIRSNKSQRQAQGKHEMLTPVIAPQELMTTDALEVLNTGFGLARAEDHKRLRLHSWCDKIRSNKSQRQAQGEHEMLTPVIAPQELMTTDALEVLNTGFGLARAEDHKRLRLHSWCDKIRSNRSQRKVG